MASNRKGMTLDEIEQLLLADDLITEDEENDIDVVIIPPDVDELTDEENIDDNETGSPQVTDVAGTLEINPTDSSEHYNEYLKTVKSNKLKWRKKDPSYTKLQDRHETQMSQQDDLSTQLIGLTPKEIFEQLVTFEIFDHIVKESTRYAVQDKNQSVFSLSVEELKTFIGILIFSSYHKLPAERDYWSRDEDLGIELIKRAMTRDQYLKVKQMLHFCNNKEAAANKSDRAFKIRSFITMLQRSFCKFGIFETHVAVDEMMVKYYGRNSLKQFIRGKPVRFGYKLWALCGPSGYCYNFDLYCGKQVPEDKTTVPLGFRVVNDMLSIMKNPEQHSVYFDNFFSSVPLFLYLRDKNIAATGTMRKNRISKCPLMEDAALKKNGKGSFDFRFEEAEEILIVKWNDNSSVLIGTNFDSVEPLANVSRWITGERKKGTVTRPHVVTNYSKYMGGVDLHDWIIGKYPISIRAKRWYWPLIIRLFDMAITNAWILHKLVNDKKDRLSAKDFRRKICLAYLKGASCAATSKKTPKPIVDIRFDQVAHYIRQRKEQRRCQNKSCRSKPRTFCKKCDVTLCIECFESYHTQ